MEFFGGTLLGESRVLHRQMSTLRGQYIKQSHHLIVDHECKETVVYTFGPWLPKTLTL